MASHVSYLKRLKSPAGSKLAFTHQQGDIVSEVISLKYDVKLLDLAPKPIQTIQLKITMLNPEIYQIQGDGESKILEYYNKSADFTTQTINFRIEVVDPNAIIDKNVVFEVTIMDVDEGITFPTNNYGFYTWTPVKNLMANQPVIQSFIE